MVPAKTLCGLNAGASGHRNFRPTSLKGNAWEIQAKSGICVNLGPYSIRRPKLYLGPDPRGLKT